MKRAILGLLFAGVGFGITTYFETATTNVIGLILMGIGVLLFFWALAKARAKKKER